MFMILAINVLLLPVAIAFFDDSLNIGWIAFSMFSDICFFVDVIFNFRTGIITNENVIILEQAKICRIYLKSWFLLDIISLLPLDYIGMIIFYSYSNRDSLIMATRALRATKLVRLVTLLKLLRAIRFLRYLSKWEQVSSRMYTYMYKNTVIMGVGYVHVLYTDGLYSSMLLYLLVHYYYQITNQSV